jgi:hypothetical protein
MTSASEPSDGLAGIALISSPSPKDPLGVGEIRAPRRFGSLGAALVVSEGWWVDEFVEAFVE